MLAIKTVHAARLRMQITESLDNAEDPKGRGIRTWVLDEEGAAPYWRERAVAPASPLRHGCSFRSPHFFVSVG